MRRISDETDFALAVRQRRRDLGVTQDQLALLAGVGRAAVIRLENHPSKVQLQTVFRVAAALRLGIFIDSLDRSNGGGESGDPAPPTAPIEPQPRVDEE